MMTVQSLSQSVNHWQFIYIASITLALLATFAIVAFAFHWEQHKAALRFSNYIYVLFSLVAVIATIVIVNKTNSLDAEKDRQVKIASDANDLEIAKANASAAQANKRAQEAIQKAEDARLQADRTETANSKLKVEVSKHEAAETKSNAELAAQTEKVNQFAQGVAQQQQGMEQQIQAVPTLGERQIKEIANQLKPFAGSQISVHMMLDAHSERLGEQVEEALKMAGLVLTVSSVDVGPNYQGVIVGVKNPSPAPHPELANGLLNAFHSVGILARGISFPQLKEDEVGIYIGPN